MDVASPDVADDAGDTRKTGHTGARIGRVEVLPHAERWRSWTLDQKWEIVGESLGPELTPTEVARKYRISTGQLCSWRQQVLDRQTLRDWGRRYNELGIDGLKSGSSSGRKPLLSGPQKAELLALAVKGPDPEKDNVVRWRCVDLRDEVRRRFDVTVHENTIGAWLRAMKLTRLQPRPFHPKKDLAAQEAYKKTSAA